VYTGVANKAFIKIKACCSWESIAWLTKTLIPPQSVDALPSISTKVGIFTAFISVLARVSIQPVPLVTAAAVWPRSVYTIPMTTDGSNYTLIDIWAGAGVGIKMVSHLTTTLHAANLVDADLLTESILLGTLINILACLVICSNIPSLRTVTIGRPCSVDTVMGAPIVHATLINIFTFLIILGCLIAWHAGTVSWPRSVHTQVGTSIVVAQALIYILTCPPVWPQDKPWWTHAEDLVVAVDALMGTSPIIGSTPTHPLTCMIVLPYLCPCQVVTTTHISSIMVGAGVLAWTMPIV
jgi:hypothetical protein